MMGGHTATSMCEVISLMMARFSVVLADRFLDRLEMGSTSCSSSGDGLLDGSRIAPGATFLLRKFNTLGTPDLGGTSI